MITSNIVKDQSWKSVLLPEFSKPYMGKLNSFVCNEQASKKNIYPPAKEYFAALNHTPVDAVKVIILGQDPYFGPGQAHGLCFSVRPNVQLPPSLENIFKELNSDLGVARPEHGCLLSWAMQGVLLLNSTLSVQEGKPGSHQNQGWELLTDSIVEYLNREKSGLVFLLWGNFAQKKGAYIDKKKHLVLTAPHPSPLSSYRGFFGCKHFSQTNNFLVKQNKTPIEWGLPPRSAVEEML